MQSRQQIKSSLRNYFRHTLIFGSAMFHGWQNNRSNPKNVRAENMTRSLKSMVGEMIVARIPALVSDEMSLIKLHGVDLNGIWIESQDFTDMMMEKLHLTSSGTTLVLFVPFHSIDYIVGSIDSLALSEKSFGLTQGD